MQHQKQVNSRNKAKKTCAAGAEIWIPIKPLATQTTVSSSLNINTVAIIKTSKATRFLSFLATTPLPDRKIKNHRHIVNRPVAEARVVEVRDAEFVALGIPEKRVAARIERPDRGVVPERDESRVEVLQPLRDHRLAASGAGAFPVDHILGARADGDAPAGVVAAQCAPHQRHLMAADHGEPVFETNQN